MRLGGNHGCQRIVTESSFECPLHRGDNDAERYVEAQLRALELQRDLLARLRAELPETVSAQKGKAAGICYDLAEHYKRGRKFDQVRGLHGVVAWCSTNEANVVCNQRGGGRIFGMRDKFSHIGAEYTINI